MNKTKYCKYIIIILSLMSVLLTGCSGYKKTYKLYNPYSLQGIEFNNILVYVDEKYKKMKELTEEVIKKLLNDNDITAYASMDLISDNRGVELSDLIDRKDIDFVLIISLEEIRPNSLKDENNIRFIFNVYDINNKEVSSGNITIRPLKGVAEEFDYYDEEQLTEIILEAGSVIVQNLLEYHESMIIEQK